MPSIALQPTTVAVDAPFPPANAQALVNFVSANLRLSGLENLTGVVISAETPVAADRDKVWAKRDAQSNRVLGFYAYSGGWLPMPAIVPSGTEEPGGAKIGELFFNLTLGALRVYDGTAWTSNFTPAGTTAARPTAVPIGYLYLDNTLGRIIRYAGSAGWTTNDGGIGDVKMVDFATEALALEKNPGWSIFSNMAGRFPLGATAEIVPQEEGGIALEEMQVEWSAQGRSASGGTREATASFIGELTLNGVSARADGTKYDALTAIGAAKTLKLTPPYKALIFLRKDF